MLTPTSPAGVDYFQADDLMIVLMHIHKVNQLRLLRKAAFLGGVRLDGTYLLLLVLRTISIIARMCMHSARLDDGSQSSIDVSTRAAYEFVANFQNA